MVWRVSTSVSTLAVVAILLAATSGNAQERPAPAQPAPSAEDAKPAEDKSETTNGDDQNGDDQETIDALVQAVRDKVPAQFDASKVSRSTVCKFIDAGDKGWVASCTPPEIEVSAENASNVFIELPPKLAENARSVTVTAGENWAKFPDLNSDEIRFDDRCGSRQQISIQLYKYRRLAPPYSERTYMRPKATADRVLRTNRAASLEGREKPISCPDVLSLLISGEREWLRVSVHTAEETFTADVRLLYLRWLVDVGGFYALRWTGDDELVTRALNGMEGKSPQTEVIRIDEPDQTSDAGVMMNFFRRNYPSLGVAFGLSFPEERSPSYYLGLSWRLLNRDTAAVATFTGGVLYSQVKTSPVSRPG